MKNFHIIWAYNQLIRFINILWKLKIHYADHSRFLTLIPHYENFVRIMIKIKMNPSKNLLGGRLCGIPRDIAGSRDSMLNFKNLNLKVKNKKKSKTLSRWPNNDARGQVGNVLGHFCPTWRLRAVEKLSHLSVKYPDSI